MPDEPEIDVHLKLSHVARLFGVSMATAWRWSKRGLLGPIEGKPARVSVAELKERFGEISPEQLDRLRRL